ncbi:hypothetical protein ABT009_12725 [Streptomyces sp. NPDC002896]|uniref:hypothetical protein n=1 Tax=Streptomyces sp. NPDC002896 TaxID=3154438 RepID=UPI003330124D
MLELGSGHGRDALYFAREGFRVQALDFSAAGRLGVFVYTVRHVGDAHYGTGTAHGDEIYEHGGFAVHFFSNDLVDALADGWSVDEVHAFEEGELPRLLWRVTQSLPH